MEKIPEQGVIQIAYGFINAYLVIGERPILVDTGTPGTGQKILRTINALGITPEEIALIVLTHGHTDHFGSVDRLKALTGAPVAIHRRDVEALQNGTMKLLPRTILGRVFILFGQEGAMVPEFVTKGPEILIDGERSLTDFGIDGAIIPTPGHTAGSLSVLLSTGEVIAGDLLTAIFNRKKPGWPIFAEDMKQVRASVSALLSRSPTRIYLGHGGPCTPESVRKLLKH
ncbi:MAG TPA: MBL fold metallo-hydrolase [Methanomicrobia archaeon]|nr:MBL fold metallo-hydrolase [Methanomicrobia archaeon]